MVAMALATAPLLDPAPVSAGSSLVTTVAGAIVTGAFVAGASAVGRGVSRSSSGRAANPTPTRRTATPAASTGRCQRHRPAGWSARGGAGGATGARAGTRGGGGGWTGAAGEALNWAVGTGAERGTGSASARGASAQPGMEQPRYSAQQSMWWGGGAR